MLQSLSQASLNGCEHPSQASGRQVARFGFVAVLGMIPSKTLRQAALGRAASSRVGIYVCLISNISALPRARAGWPIVAISVKQVQREVSSPAPATGQLGFAAGSSARNSTSISR